MSTEVSIRAGTAALPGTLVLPPDAGAIVAFAHGSGSSRHSPRNRHVAEVLHARRIGTLLFDLLTPLEDRDYARRFEIDLLTQRLLTAVAWLRSEPRTGVLPVGLFGASTGAAAALCAAAARPGDIGAVVSRGGRPDLAGAADLARVRCPTLLLVGGLDDVVIDLNRQAYGELRCEKELAIVPGATHLFEEPGTLEQVAAAAAGWFARWLAGSEGARLG